MRIIILKLIRFYQKVFSRDTGFLSIFYSERICRFYPTCSEYTYQSIEKFGVWKGVYLGLKRILQCHPWGKGGADPVLKKFRF